MVMKSVNFEHLRETREELASLGGFAEAYAHSDPPSAFTKLRIFCERVVQEVYRLHHLDMSVFGAKPKLNDLIQHGPFRDEVPKAVLERLDTLRFHGNKGAHGNKQGVTTETALQLLRCAFEVGNWLYLTYDEGSVAQHLAFVDPEEGGTTGLSKATLKQQKKELRIELAQKENDMEALLAQMDEAREKQAAAEKKAQESENALAALVAQRREFAQKSVNALQWSEADTRKFLIDSMLVDAGWNVGTDGCQTDQVGQEVEIQHQPTETGIGYADYVLWGDDGKPLAVVEVKKTAENVKKGKEQARIYADGLEKTFGQRPVIFYSNGGETYIWDDVNGYPQRRVYGFYSKASLEQLLFQKEHRKNLLTVAVDTNIAGRMYQLEAIKRVAERFEDHRREALLVQATGTGKTRTSIALADVLLRANWAKRVLFLCDRVELRRQAKNAFTEFLPGQSAGIVTASGRVTPSSDGNKEYLVEGARRVYLATYPAMMKCFAQLDPGFFQVIVIDESHRSIYKTYLELLNYFDALRIGLTATPVEKIDRNTFSLFNCKKGEPTMNYALGTAVDDGYLVPPRIQHVSTDFTRKGIRYKDLNEAQKAEADDQVDDASGLDVDAKDIDRKVFNKDSNRLILRNLMDKGIRDASGTRPGKSIIFARNHAHAVLLEELFDEMYPQYGGSFCKVIDSHDPRASQLIDDFKNTDISNKNDITIAVSVDMLDTGIDVPEVVNLVFAKPVKSSVKFWQMVGRGTRLCENLFGPGEHKEDFLIFDHWRNFEWFEEKPPAETDRPRTRSLPEQLFAARLDLMGAAIEKLAIDIQQPIAKTITADILALDDVQTIAVKEKWKDVKQAQNVDLVAAWDAQTEAHLRTVIEALMQWRNIRGMESAYRFDVLVTKAQRAALLGTADLADLKDQVQNSVSALPKNLNEVKAKAAHIKNVENPTFWHAPDFADLEEIRRELRGLMRFRAAGPKLPKAQALTLDISDGGLISQEKSVRLEGLELREYRKKVEQVLQDHFEDNQTLLKIRAQEPVTDHDLEELRNLILQLDGSLDIHDLLLHQPEFAGHLDLALRSIVGIDPERIEVYFAGFAQAHQTHLSAKQLKFLQMLKNLIAKTGLVHMNQLWDAPFTHLDADGITGVFGDTLVNELLDLIAPFQPPKAAAEHAGLEATQ